MYIVLLVNIVHLCVVYVHILMSTLALVNSVDLNVVPVCVRLKVVLCYVL